MTSSRRPGLSSRLVALVALVAFLAPAVAGEEPPRALVVVRTLVMDAMGTRAVDTDTARIPFGSKGLLIKRVPYAGPPLSFRLAARVGSPQDAGLPITLTSEVWSGEASSIPPEDRVARREEATVLTPEGSYLFEIDHDPAAGRRIVLSIAARPMRPGEEAVPADPAPSATPVRFLLEIEREAGGRSDPPDVRVMSSMVGQPITYSSGVQLPRAPGGEAPSGSFLGMAISLRAEQVQGNLVSVGVQMSGAEFVDAARRRLEPFRQEAVRTVPSGTPFELVVEIPADGGGSAAIPEILPVRYVVRVTPSLEP